MLKPAPVNRHTTVYSSTPAKWVDFDTIVLPYKEVEPVSTARDCKTQFYINSYLTNNNLNFLFCTQGG